MPMTKLSLKTQVKEYLLSYIRDKNLQPGDRLLTQRELAEMLHTSQKVAQMALNSLEEEGIIIRRLGSGSFLARRHEMIPRTPNGGRNIFVLIPNLRNPQFSEFAAELETVLLRKSRQMRLMTFHAVSSFREIVNVMVEEGCGGIITTDLPLPLKNFILQHEIPAVLIRLWKMRDNPRKATHEILLNIEDQAKILSEHLLSRGYRRFYLAGGMTNSDGELSFRFQIMQKYLESSGSSVHIIPEKSMSENGLNYESVGRELAMKILKQYQPSSAAVFYNTARALGAMKVFQRLGKNIPQDIAVAGFDNIFPARLVEPELTVTDARYIEAAHRAVDLVLSPHERKETLSIAPLLCCGRSVGHLDKK